MLKIIVDIVLVSYIIISIFFIIIKVCVGQAQNKFTYEPLPNGETNTNGKRVNEQTFTNRADKGGLIVSAIILIMWMLHAIMCQDPIELQYNIWPVAWIFYAIVLTLTLIRSPQQSRALHINIHLKILYLFSLIAAVANLFWHCLIFGGNINLEYFLMLLSVGLLFILVLLLGPIYNEVNYIHLISLWCEHLKFYKVSVLGYNFFLEAAILYLA